MVQDAIKNNILSSQAYKDEVSIDTISHRYQMVLNGYLKKEGLFAKISFYSFILAIVNFIAILYLMYNGVSIIRHNLLASLVLLIGISFFSIFLIHVYQNKPIYLKDSYGNPISEFWFLYHNLTFLSEQQKEKWCNEHYKSLDQVCDFSFTPSILNWGKNSLRKISVNM